MSLVHLFNIFRQIIVFGMQGIVVSRKTDFEESRSYPIKQRITATYNVNVWYKGVRTLLPNGQIIFKFN